MRTITLDAKEFPIRLSLNGVEEIQKRYGKIENLFDQIHQIGEARWVLWLMIADGIAYRNYRDGTTSAPPTENEIGLLMTGSDLASSKHTEAIVAAFNDCMGGEKNVTAGELQQMACAAMAAQSTLPA